MKKIILIGLCMVLSGCCLTDGMGPTYIGQSCQDELFCEVNCSYEDGSPHLWIAMTACGNHNNNDDYYNCTEKLYYQQVCQPMYV